MNRDHLLCLGLEREGAPVLRLQRGKPQGEQVCLHTANMEYDENLADRPKKEVSALSSSVAGLTFVGIDDDDDEDEEEIEGYGVVNVVSVTEANAARVEKPGAQEKWSNPTKILKRKVEKEKKYVTGKMIRSGDWQPVTATDMMEEENMDVEIEEVPVEEVPAVPTAPEKKPRNSCVLLVQRRKFMDYLKENSNTEDLLDEIMDQRVNLRLRDIITSSESLMRLMFQGIPKKEELTVDRKSTRLNSSHEIPSRMPSSA